MRMFMTPPHLMCRKHLLGNHVESHMILGHLQRGRQVAKFVAHNCLEPLALEVWHDAVAAEMLARGYRHATPLRADLHALTEHLPEAHRLATVDVPASLADLCARCPECRARVEAREAEQRKVAA